MIRIIMVRFNKLSDEELAAYLEGMFSEDKGQMPESSMDIDTLEVLGVSKRALEKFPADNVISFPEWHTHNIISMPTADSSPHFAMAGFLGDNSAADEDFEDDSAEIL